MVVIEVVSRKDGVIMALTIASPATASTGTLTTTGMGSGIDVNGLVSKLMAVEQQPLTMLQTQEAADQAKITAYGSLSGAVSSFQTAVQSLTSTSTFSAQSVKVGDSSVASASADGTAVSGTHTLTVTNLASSQILESGTAYSATSTQIGTGTLTIDFGTYSGGAFAQNSAKGTKTIDISASQGSLAGIRDAINSAGIGVTASIMNDGSGYRLIMSSTDSGSSNALRIAVANTSGTLSDLAYNAASGGTSNMSQTQAAQDAQFSVDGVAITKSSNTVSDVISGVTLNLTGTNTGSSTTFGVSRNTSAIASAVTSLVSAYNSAASTIKGLTAYDASTNTGSVLLGDFTTQSVQSQIRSIMNTNLAYATGGVSSLADLGVTFNKDGTLSLDSTKLASTLADPSKDVSSLFLALGKPTDSLVSYTASTAATKSGNYAVNISKIATNGLISSSAAIASNQTVLSSDTLNMTVDGIAATVKLNDGTYTNAGLVAALQSAINGTSAFSGAGVAVTVGMNGTQANVAGSTPAGTTITSGINDSIDVTVDGGAPVTVALTPGTTYTSATLASMVQAKVNAALSGGASVTVTQTNGILSIKSNSYGAGSGVTVADSGATTGATSLLGAATQSGSGTGTASLKITSNSFGATSNVSITGGTAASALFGAATATGTAGVDVAGTIDGVAATGSGRTLTSTAGNSKGLKLTINGGITGSRGTVSFDRGIADQLNTALTSVLDTTNGTIATATNGLNKTISALQDRQTVLRGQLAVIQQRYLDQFNAMDTLVASLQSTSNFLTQQLAAMSGNSSSTSSTKIG
ncbi:MAG: flagellar filament capping protein FliD [Rhodocyclaceae bacterium]|nr:flagellar filament capping protein FliD [Rhodocyclaceae bacterium]